MHRLLKIILTVCADKRGATAVEYGLIASLMTISILGALNALGAANGQNYNEISSAMTNAHGG